MILEVFSTLMILILLQVTELFRISEQCKYLILRASRPNSINDRNFILNLLTIEKSYLVFCLTESWEAVQINYTFPLSWGLLRIQLNSGQIVLKSA